MSTNVFNVKPVTQKDPYVPHKNSNVRYGRLEYISEHRLLTSIIDSIIVPIGTDNMTDNEILRLFMIIVEECMVYISNITNDMADYNDTTSISGAIMDTYDIIDNIVDTYIDSSVLEEYGAMETLSNIGLVDYIDAGHAFIPNILKNVQQLIAQAVSKHGSTSVLPVEWTVGIVDNKINTLYLKYVY